MLFRKMRELEGLVEARTKALKDAEKEVKELSNERLSNIAVIYSDKEIFRQILDIVEGNSYNRSNEQKLRKIKELATTGIN